MLHRVSKASGRKHMDESYTTPKWTATENSKEAVMHEHADTMIRTVENTM